MPSSWIVARPTKPDGRYRGKPRYRVVYRLAGAGSPHHYGGSFATKAEALERKKWVDGELAGLAAATSPPDSASAWNSCGPSRFAKSQPTGRSLDARAGARLREGRAEPRTRRRRPAASQ
jgi:hypothetical protein